MLLLITYSKSCFNIREILSKYGTVRLVCYQTTVHLWLDVTSVTNGIIGMYLNYVEVEQVYLAFSHTLLYPFRVTKSGVSGFKSL